MDTLIDTSATAGSGTRPRRTGAQAPRIAILIPALNEAATIGLLLRECRCVAPTARLIVVDDGSSDDTASVAEAAGALVLRNPVNAGKGASLARGMAWALDDGAALVVTLDADGQHLPADIPRLLAAAEAWPDATIIGSRRVSGRAAAPALRRMANRVADFWVSWAARQPVDDSQSGFRVWPASALRAVLPRSAARGFAFESEMLIEAGRQGFRIVAVDIPAIYGPALRASHFRPLRDIARITTLVGGRLLRRGMDPAGLWRALTVPLPRYTAASR